MWMVVVPYRASTKLGAAKPVFLYDVHGHVIPQG